MCVCCTVSVNIYGLFECKGLLVEDDMVLYSNQRYSRWHLAQQVHRNPHSNIPETDFFFFFKSKTSVSTCFVGVGVLQLILPAYVRASAKKNRRRWVGCTMASRVEISKSKGIRRAPACGLRSGQTSSPKPPKTGTVRPARLPPTQTAAPFGWHTRARSPLWTDWQLRLISDWEQSD